eukprot:GHVS01028233.1.p1 GENE.GHVS01028233.1~~GHVS01028233.1.p1  ORF type:complete len:205 (-),score=29.72 GHVS01028233.1:218-832(-)
MKDYFFYSQIRSENEDTTRSRVLDGSIPVEEIPLVLCSLGWYPTDQETRSIISQVKYSKFAETGQFVNRIFFDEFVKLYVNHRPVFAVGPNELKAAFAVISGNESDPAVARERLVHLLTNVGEKMTPAEIESCLQTMMPTNVEAPVQADSSSSSRSKVSRAIASLPDLITPEFFSSNVLCFQPSAEADSAEPQAESTSVIVPSG